MFGKSKTYMWMCPSCSAGQSGYEKLRDCEKDQIRHAKHRHRRESGYTVTSRGRVIYRIP